MGGGHAPTTHHAHTQSEERTRGAEGRSRRGKKMKAAYIWQMINQVGRYLPFFFFFFLMAFLCVSQQGEFKNTIKNFLGEVHVKNIRPKKLREKKTFSFLLFPSVLFYRVFGRFSA
jgi:hypothetical protein